MITISKREYATLLVREQKLNAYEKCDLFLYEKNQEILKDFYSENYEYLTNSEIIEKLSQKFRDKMKTYLPPVPICGGDYESL